VRKLWLVARKELRMTATRTYLIATAIGPLVIIALIVLPVLLVRNQRENK
jgi:ABC-type Na+ efflux pump permease subunit